VLLAVTGCWLMLAAPSPAAVAPDGSGFGISDPDPISSRSLDASFARLRPRTFRFIVDWDVANDPGEKAQALERIARARAVGVEEVAITFERPARGVPPSREVWLAHVTAFIQEFTPHVDWWSAANEPNLETGPLQKLDPARLAEYSSDLAGWLAVYHPEDGLISPEFSDGGEVSGYIQEFRLAGGQFGTVIGWHAYNGAQQRDLAGTNELLAAVPDLPLWITEVGVHENDPREPLQLQAQQVSRVEWIVGTLAAHPRVWRISYYHMRDHNPAWDTALVDSAGVPRLAWYAWCAASHGGNASDPDCLPVSDLDPLFSAPSERRIFPWGTPTRPCFPFCGSD
jgi:hypothetical protein